MTKSLAARLASAPPRAMYHDGAYAPFGEPYAQNGTADLSFTGMNQDTVANLYDFPAREYGTQGRWPSPDPADLAAADPTDPQSWNRYAYVRNSPLNLIDPLGLALVPVGRGSDYPLNCLVDNVTDVVWCPGLFAGGGRVLLKPYQSAPNEGGGGAGSAPQSQAANPNVQRPAPPTPPGWCTAMENGGTTVMVVSGIVFVAGTGADGTVIGAPVGVLSQGSAAIGGILGGIVDGLGKLGKAAGVCN